MAKFKNMAITKDPRAKAFIFDLDGTLSNSLPVHVETWKMIGRKFGFNFDPVIVHEMTGRPTIEFAKRVVKQYDVNETPENIVKMKQESFWDLAHMLVPIEDVVELVKTYHEKIPMSVGTGASAKSAEVQLKALGLDNYLKIVVSADDVKMHKPEPDTFIKCAQLMGVEPEFCQVFEDGDLGITAAKTAGMMVTDVREFIEYGEWIHS
jgi:beta-phosphoglucomutase family hydrolase